MFPMRKEYELDIPESCIFPYWRNNKPANENTQQTTHCIENLQAYLCGLKCVFRDTFISLPLKWHLVFNYQIAINMIWAGLWPAIWCQQPLGPFTPNSWGFTLEQEITKTQEAGPRLSPTFKRYYIFLFYNRKTANKQIKKAQKLSCMQKHLIDVQNWPCWLGIKMCSWYGDVWQSCKRFRYQIINSISAFPYLPHLTSASECSLEAC